MRVVTLSERGHSYKEEDVYYMRSVDISRIYPGARAVCFPGSRLYEDVYKRQLPKSGRTVWAVRFLSMRREQANGIMW